MDDTDVRATKQSLRESALRARRGLSGDERRTASAEAVERLAGLPEMRRARTVLLYAATDEELDPAGLLPRLHARDARLLFPRVAGSTLELATASELRALTVGYRGVREPVGPTIDPSVVDVAVIPGVAFDPHGGRLGQGGGHYDRLLPSLEDAAVIGLCFSCQMVPRVPREEHDRRVEIIVTERAVYRRRDDPPASA